MRLVGYLFLIIAIQSCGSHPQNESTVLADNDNYLDEPTQLSLMKIPIVDRRFGLTALTCIVPEGWNVQSDSWWVKSDYDEPFKYALVVSDIDSVNQINIYPTLSYFTSSEISTVPATSKDRLEMMHSMSLPNTAADAIKDFLIPLYRPAIHDLRIKESVPLSSIDEGGGDGTRNKETGMVRVQYVINGNMVEEVFFATLSKTFTPIDRYNTQCRWHIENAVSCRFYTGYMDDQLEILQTLTCSLQYGFNWLLKYNAVLQQLQSLHTDSLSTESFSNLITQAKTDPSEAANVYQNYQRRIWLFTQAYNRYQPMLQSYVDDSDDYVQLPGGFTVAWKSDDGHYLLTDSASLRPRSPSTTWHELRRNESSQEHFPMISGNVVFD